MTVFCVCKALLIANEAKDIYALWSKINTLYLRCDSKYLLLITEVTSFNCPLYIYLCYN